MSTTYHNLLGAQKRSAAPFPRESQIPPRTVIPYQGSQFLLIGMAIDQQSVTHDPHANGVDYWLSL